MEIKIESKIGKLRNDEKYIYTFVSDCNNFKQLVGDKVKNWQSESDACSFSVDGVGDLMFRIVEKTPNNMIKFSIENAKTENVFLWIQLKNISLGDTRIKLTTKLNANPMIKMLISKPLKEGLDKVVDTLERIC